MDCQHLIYKPIKSMGPYDRYMAKQKQKQVTQKKQLFYSQIFKFTSSRYPKQFLVELEREINPFEYSLQTLREIILKKYPDLSEDVVNESVEYVFGKKSRQSVMIRESETVIEDGDQFIRNGRKLIKQDFSYHYDRPLNDTLPPADPKVSDYSPRGRGSDRGDISKRSNRSRPQLFESIKMKPTLQDNPADTQRSHLNSLNSPSRNQMGMSKNQLFNEFIAQEIKKQSNRYKNMQVIYQNDPDDILIKEQFILTKRPGFTDRSGRSRLQESFPGFKQRDIVVHLQGGQTGRSEMEELNHMLSQVSVRCEEKEGQTQRSDRGMHMIKISKKNMDNLYSMKGSLKLQAVRRAANRMITQFS